MKATDIEWTDFSSNPLRYRDKEGREVWACVKHSPGCANCYAEAIALRYGKGAKFTRANMETITTYVSKPELHKLRTARTCDGIPVSGRRLFLGDMTDIFGEWVTDEMLLEIFATIALRHDVTFQVLTKRPDRAAKFLSTHGLHNELELAADRLWPGKGHPSVGGKHLLPQLPLRNLHLGASTENQAEANDKVHDLLKANVWRHFLSVEPQIGHVTLTDLHPSENSGYRLDALRGHWNGTITRDILPVDGGRKIAWVIIGGESGRGARDFQIEWARSLVQECRATGTPVFVKQLGSKPSREDEAAKGIAEGWAGSENADPADIAAMASQRIPLKLASSKGGDMEEWPDDLRIREWPDEEEPQA